MVLAVEVHGSQRDKISEPYLFHVMRVATEMDTDEERVVALLHDVLEDAVPRISLEGVAAVSTGIESIYGWTVLDAVSTLTRDPKEMYMDYIKRLSCNPLAVKVKFADLRDNTDRYRMEKLAPVDRERLRKKYYEAMDYLCKHGALMPKETVQ